MGLIVPAVLPSSHKDLEDKLSLFIQIPSVERIQIDVVDGKFASPASWPYSAPRELRGMAERNETLPALDRLEYEIDLMCLDAERAAESWLTLGATRLVFHAESTVDLPRLFASVKKRYGAGDGFVPGLISFGVAINIASDLKIIESCLDEVEFVQFMGISRIGRQGQLFDKRVFDKISLFHTRHPKIPMQVDGGVSLENARELVLLGVSSLVVGSVLSHSNNPAATLATFEALNTSYGV